jgi:hypothetical protein
MKLPFPCALISGLITGLCLFANPCLAGRPLATDDGGTIDVGKCELESFVGASHQRGAPSETRVSAQWGCGVAKGTQLQVALAGSRSDGSTDQFLTAAGKTALNAPEDGGTVFALGYGLVGAKPAAGHWQQDVAYLNGIMTVTAAKDWLVHANLGASHSRIAHQSTVNWALAVEKIGESGVDWMAETFGDNREHHPWVQGGVRWSAIPDRLILDASLGRQSAPGHPTALTIGFRLLFN